MLWCVLLSLRHLRLSNIALKSLFVQRTERDATNWSSDKLKSLMVGLSVENEEGSCEVTEVSKLDGEASINNRKGKLIFFYEWNLKANWIGESQRTCLLPVHLYCGWFKWTSLSVALYITVEDDVNGCFHCYNEDKQTGPCRLCVSATVSSSCPSPDENFLSWSSVLKPDFSVLPGKTKAGVKYKGTVEVPNLSDENDMEDLDVSVQQRHICNWVPTEENRNACCVRSFPDFHIAEQGRTRDAAPRPDEDKRSR